MQERRFKFPTPALLGRSLVAGCASLDCACCSSQVNAAKARGKPYTIVFVGVNGVGKSTNLAKICYWLLQNDIKVRPHSSPCCHKQTDVLCWSYHTSPCGSALPVQFVTGCIDGGTRC